MVCIAFLTSVTCGAASSKRSIDLNALHRSLCSRLFVFGPWFEYGVDRQLTKYTHGAATVSISSRMGVILKLR